MLTSEKQKYAFSNSLNTKFLGNKETFISARAATGSFTSLLSLGGPIRCLQLFATLQTVQKVQLFVRNVTVAYAWFYFLFS